MFVPVPIGLSIGILIKSRWIMRGLEQRGQETIQGEERMKQNDCIISRYEQDPSTSRLIFIYPSNRTRRSCTIKLDGCCRGSEGALGSEFVSAPTRVQCSEWNWESLLSREENRFSGWGRNVFSTNNDIRRRTRKGYGKRKNETEKKRTSSAYYSNTNEKTRAHIILDISMHQPYT